MINRIIEYSATNRGLVIILVLSLVVIGVWSMQQSPSGCHSGSFRPAGHHLHRVARPQSRSRGRPDHLSDRFGHARGAACQRRPRRFGLWILVRLRDLRGRHRHLLGPQPRARIPEQDHAASFPKAWPRPWDPTPRASAGPSSTRWSIKSGKHNLAELRSFNDWYLRYWLESVPGVAEVATVGGFVKQYQVNVDPNKLLAYNLPLTQVMDAIRNSNKRSGRAGRGVHRQGIHGARARLHPDRSRTLRASRSGRTAGARPFWCRTWPTCDSGPDMRRGALRSSTGEGEVDGRHRRRALWRRTPCDVIERVKAKLEEMQALLAAGRRGGRPPMTART